MSNLNATEPRLLPELCVADNIMAVSNFLQKEKEKKQEQVIQEQVILEQVIQEVPNKVPNKVN
jgi:ABC-type lipopolysaccharide export system ATPase subunit